MSESLAREALKLHEDFHEQLGIMITGEELAKTAMAAAFVLRKNLVLGGPAGGGKTTLAWEGGRLMEETASGKLGIVRLEGQHDVTATQLVGGEIPHEKEIIDPSTGRTTHHERGIHKVEGVVKPNTGYMAVDEFNLFNQEASQALNSALENRELRTRAGTIMLPGLRTVVAILNPTDKKSAGQPVSERQGSRLFMGVKMGVDESVPYATRMDRLEAIDKHEEDPTKGDPELMKPVATFNQLEQLREYALDTPIDDKLKKRIRHLSVKCVDALAGEGIHEDDGRLFTQMKAVSKVLAVLTAKDQLVGEEHVNQAVDLVLTARLIAEKKKTIEQMNSIVHSVIAA